jgi:hypothetical protein
MAWTLLNAITRFFDVLLYPFRGMHPFVGLIVVSIVTGVVMLVVFGRTTNQAALRRVKAAIVASIIEIWLFKDKPGLMFGAAAKVLRHNLSYLRYSLVAVVFVIVPVLLIMVQLGIRYAHRPLTPSEEAIVSVKLAPQADPTYADLDLLAPEGVEVLTPPLRMEDEGEVDWRVRADKPGTYELKIRGQGTELSKKLVVENSIVPLAPVRSKALSWDFFLYPVEKPLPKESSVKSIEVGYPPARLDVAGININWLIVFFVVSVVAGYAVKGIFHVEV